MEKGMYMVLIVAAVAVVGLVFLTMNTGQGDLAGEAIKKVSLTKSSSVQNTQTATPMTLQQARLQMLIQRCMNLPSRPSYAFCRQGALQQIGGSNGDGQSDSGGSCEDFCSDAGEQCSDVCVDTADPDASSDTDPCQAQCTNDYGNCMNLC